MNRDHGHDSTCGAGAKRSSSRCTVAVSFPKLFIYIAACMCGFPFPTCTIHPARHGCESSPRQLMRLLHTALRDGEYSAIFLLPMRRTRRHRRKCRTRCALRSPLDPRWRWRRASPLRVGAGPHCWCPWGLRRSTVSCSTRCASTAGCAREVSRFKPCASCARRPFVRAPFSFLLFSDFFYLSTRLYILLTYIYTPA